MKIAVGLSGGVDSSVSAYLLQQEGYDVIGIFMKNWEEEDTDTYCSAAEDREDAERIARRLGIPFHVINFAAEYWDNVFEYFLAEYQAGRTPNPDILCNKEIKFKAFLNYAKKLSAEKIATGHYARTRLEQGKVQLLKGLDPQKDQSYFLYALQQAQLTEAIFPVGELCKTEVRRIAGSLGFENANKKDSTGICFIGERRFKDFLSRYLPAQPGCMVDENGKIIGQHSGLMYYTIGQRQGIGIGGQKRGSGSPWYVAAKNMDRNELLVVQGQDHPLLFKPALLATHLNWISGISPKNGKKLTAKIRYRQADQACTLHVIDYKHTEVKFDTPQRAVTAGQSIVFYEGDICLGGGIIIDSYFKSG